MVRPITFQVLPPLTRWKHEINPPIYQIWETFPRAVLPGWSEEPKETHHVLFYKATFLPFKRSLG